MFPTRMMKSWSDDKEGLRTGYDSRGNIFESHKWLAEASLWSPWAHECTVEASSECDVLSIDAGEFAELAAADADLCLQFSKYASSFVHWLNNEFDRTFHGGLDLGPQKHVLNLAAHSALHISVVQSSKISAKSCVTDGGKSHDSYGSNKSSTIASERFSAMANTFRKSVQMLSQK
eukprot:gnl/MRDRNA2_/MRDRNA2_289406_c0_seq1.p1 gnl/MRDRNA2_/MRDRNA2_289406_c0~~gnl/MRDRNA2_/MRDRNA2_289406_c0_seq1.p1  ORF type:complete len:183 (-),score=28.04 gnl/MRDRNA2_/MRDRNA2_289406_c0_seq1:6-533(-)